MVGPCGPGEDWRRCLDGIRRQDGMEMSPRARRAVWCIDNPNKSHTRVWGRREPIQIFVGTNASRWQESGSIFAGFSECPLFTSFLALFTACNYIIYICKSVSTKQRPDKPRRAAALTNLIGGSACHLADVFSKSEV